MLSTAPHLHFCKLRASLGRKGWLELLILIALGAVYFSGIRDIPFHPDESTNLYMSTDLEAWFTTPKSLAWSRDRSEDPRQRYRLLDAPLTRNILGLGRKLSGHAALSSDWDWGQDWEQNAAAGALPAASLLLAGRLALSLLFPVTLLLVYLYADAMDGRLAATVAILALGTNALVLLHTRRAMAEGPLLFGVSAVIASWLIAPRRPWLAGLAMALAFGAKQSTLALLPVGLLAAAWVPGAEKIQWSRALKNLLQFLLVFLLLAGLLNPVAWRQPISAVWAAARARSELMRSQVSDTARLAPSQVLDNPVERSVALLGHLYLTPPAFAETENYREQTSGQVLAYLSKPWNHLFRDPLGAGIWLFFTLLGISMVPLGAMKEHNPRRRIVLLALAGTLCQALGLILMVPLPWQRYVIPMIPFVCLWIGTGIAWTLKFILNTRAAYAESRGAATG